MGDIINLLSDTIANQIAAGEVIQRPASVVKELIENSLDAGAHNIQLIVKDAGRTLIQVIDDGKGISKADAKMAFERHATSKIRTADDLFSITTMGFRGEALASIAAVAQVELKTARQGDQTGTLLRISGSEIETQESIACMPGSVFSVKNLFFNVPARRKFLKANETEFRNIITEFERIVLVNPHIAFTFSHNDAVIMNLPVSNIKQRIINVFGKRLNTQLISVSAETSFVTVTGFIGTPDSSRKRSSMQFFFANNRYMRHSYFHRAVTHAFEPFINASDAPNYFIYITIDPASIDVNIHPTKTEIKFENERAIWLVISGAVKEAIEKSSAGHGLNFSNKETIEMPVYDHNREKKSNIEIKINQGYDPFRNQKTYNYHSNVSNWEQLHSDTTTIEPIEIHEIESAKHRQSPSEILFEERKNILIYRGKYLVTPIKSGLCFINLRRARVRVSFDDYMQRISKKQGISQGALFPEIITLTPKEVAILPFLLDELAYIGFDICDLGNDSYSINGIPAGLEGIDPVETLRDILDKVLETGCEVKEEITEVLALALARKTAVQQSRNLKEEEAASLIARLFSSSSPNYTPNGKSIIFILTDEELERRF
ncbi:MAG: DNA mismatch repair endonuclease MutL [Dysgonamonadaceae bacterium]|jgi:DNA mismatch repair protein MutL|nr:DNA mismatch repair endonuclease MutL [Dysgonamonadaceae bacterium]